MTGALTPTVWDGCYDDQWRGLIVPAAVAHPAKFAPGLIARIIRHGLDRGWWRKGEKIGDPFGGIGGGGIAAASYGLAWIGVELEPRFCEWARQNFELNRRVWQTCGDPLPRIVQGDSRKFAELIGEASAVITSPPYGAESVHDRNGIDLSRCERPGQHSQAGALGYGEASGQIGRLPTGSADAVVTSPPYVDRSTEPHKLGGGKPTRSTGQSADRNKGDYVYPSSPGQIGKLADGRLDGIVTSPPNAETAPEKTSRGIDIEKQWQTYRASGGGMSLEKFRAQQARHAEGYGRSEGQIGALKCDGIVTSPPWETNAEGSRKAGKFKNTAAILTCNRGHGASDAAVLAQAKRDEEKVYGDSPGQIGQEAQETYWQAMAVVYRQCWLALKSGGYMAVVVKDYVKDKQRVPLCDQTLTLLSSLGFELVERIRAMLVKERRSAGLFGEQVQRKERKSFFRRLAERKGSPRIDWEEVLVVRKVELLMGWPIGWTDLRPLATDKFRQWLEQHGSC